MKFARLTNITDGVVIATDESPQDGYVEAPENVERLWELVGAVWQKSAALIAIEAAEAERLLKRTEAENGVAVLRTWADEAAADVAAWDAATTVDKMIATKRLLNRTGIFFRKFADFYEGYNFQPSD